MAFKILLGGFGGQYTSETITGSAAGANGADTLDMSYVGQFSVAMDTITSPGASTLQVQQTFDPPASSSVNWSNLGSPVAMSTGTVVRFPVTNGPYGVIRLQVIDPAASASGTFRVTGFPVQEMA